MRFSDFGMDVAEETNAVLSLREAVTHLAPGTSIDDFFFEPEASLRALDDVSELIRDNRAVFELVREARAQPQCVWFSPDENVTHFTILSELSSYRQLAKLLWVAAFYHHQSGNHTETLECIHDIIVLCTSLASYPTLTAQLVADAISDIAFSFIEEFAATLEIEDDTTDSSAATRRQMQSLIADLQDEEPFRSASVRTFHGERAVQYDMLESFGEDMPGLVHWIAKPLLILECVRAMKHGTAFAEAAAKDHWHIAVSNLPEESQFPTLLERLSQPWSSIPISSHRRAFELYFEFLAKRRLAVTGWRSACTRSTRGRSPMTS